MIGTLCRRCGQTFDVPDSARVVAAFCPQCRSLPPLSRPTSLPPPAVTVARPIPVAPSATAELAPRVRTDVNLQAPLWERWARAQVSTLVSMAVHLLIIVVLGAWLFREKPKTVLELVASQSIDPAEEVVVEPLKLEPAPVPAIPLEDVPATSLVTIDPLSSPPPPTIDVPVDLSSTLQKSLDTFGSTGVGDNFGGVAGLTALSSRLNKAGAKSGDVQVSLMWNNRNDLDLHVQCPGGEEISFRHRRSRTRGMLDVDMNAGYNFTDEPVENVFWPPKAAPKGQYVVLVHLFRNYGKPGPTEYQVAIKIGDELRVFKGEVSEDDPLVMVHKFTW